MGSILGDFIELSIPPAVGETIPALRIEEFEGSNGYVRPELGFITAGEPTNNGVTPVEGSASLEKYNWQIACHLSAGQARILGAMMRWQDRTYKGLNNDGTPKAQGDGRLIVRDGLEMVDSERAPHSRTLWESYQETWDSNYVYGFADFYVFLLLPPEHKRHLGVNNGTGEDTKLITFVLQEV